MMRRTLLIYALSLTIFSPATAQSGSLALEKLKTELEALRNDSEMAHASWGICVMQPESRNTILEYNSSMSLAPASTQKIITTAAGLSILGPSFSYTTRLEYDGSFDSINGVLNGNLYIKGSGDPSLESFFFKDGKDTVKLVDKWADFLKTKNIRSISGSVVADASVFEDESTESNWAWGDMENYYGAGASGLSYKDDMYSLFFNSGKANDSARLIRISPEIPGFSILNYVKAYGTEDEAYIYGAPYTTSRYITGTIPPNKSNFEVKGALPDPSFLLAYDLKNALSRKKVPVNGPATSVRELKLNHRYNPQTRKEIGKFGSPSLEKIVYWTNMFSVNLFAEHIMKTIALTKRGFGSSTGGIDEIAKFWKSKGIDIKGMALFDGCGLARANTVTARQLTEILCYMTRDRAYLSFFNSLPVAGKTGTMKGLLKGTSAENNLRAKSGSFNRVRSFAGYVNSKNGQQLAFALIANNFDYSSNEMRKKLERIMELISELD